MRGAETVSALQYFLNPLKKFFSAVEIDKVFVNIPVSFPSCRTTLNKKKRKESITTNISRYCCLLSPTQDLVKVHKSLMLDVQDSILNKNALNLYHIFISYKERLLMNTIHLPLSLFYSFIVRRS